MAKANATGRSSNDKHVRLYDWLTASEAWSELSGNAVKLLIYIATFDNGSNNGELFMSERHAADGINVSKKTAHRLLVELQEKGFLVQTAPGSFRTKRSPAAQWRLTFKPWPSRSKGPTNEWRNWRASKKCTGGIFTRFGSSFFPKRTQSGLYGCRIYSRARHGIAVFRQTTFGKKYPTDNCHWG